jgi:hypothetical protein
MAMRWFGRRFVSDRVAFDRRSARARRSRPWLGEDLERRTLLAGLAFQATSLASKVFITPPGGGATERDGSIPDVNTSGSVDNNPPNKPTDPIYSENILTTSPSSDKTSNVLDIVSRGGLSTNSLFSVKQSAGLATEGTPGDVTVNIIPTNPSENPGDKVTVQLSALFQVVTLAGQNYQATVIDDVHYAYNGGSPPPLLSTPSSGQDLKTGESDPGSATFQAKIGDSFTLHFSDEVSGTSVEPFGFNYVYYKTDLSLNISVKVQPDITMDDVSFKGSCSSIAYDYQTKGDTGKFTVGLYFSPTSSYDPTTAVPVTDPSTGQAATLPITPPSPNAPKTPGVFSFSSPPSLPSNTTDLLYLLAVADPSNAISAANPNKAASLTLPDIAITSFDWSPDNEDTWKSDPTDAGGVSLTYSISGSDLPQVVPIELYWATGKTLDTHIGDPIILDNVGEPLLTETVQGKNYEYDLSAARLDTPKPGAKYLLAVVDPPDSQDPSGLIIEPNKKNNLAYLDASPESILYSSVHYEESGKTITAYFMPAEGNDPPEPDQPGRGALNIKQAAALLGVQSFNWIQKIGLPTGWQAFSADLRQRDGDYALKADPRDGVRATPTIDPTGAELRLVTLSNGSKGVALAPDYKRILPVTALDSTMITDPLKQSGTYQADNGSLSFLVVFNQALKSAVVSIPSANPNLDVDINTFQPPDNLEYFYNLGADVEARTNDYEVRFKDGPTFGDLLLSGDEAIQFATQLAGVRSDDPDHPVTWGDLAWGTKIEWTSNAVSSTVESFFRADQPGGGPPAVSGGIISVSTDLPPVLSPLANYTVNQGGSVTAVAFATDPNQGQTLTYSLDPGAPSGAAIDPKTGAFSWAVPASEPLGKYPVTVRVTDNGTPLLSSATTFTITVTAPAPQAPFLAAANYPLTDVATNPGAIADPDAIATGDFNGDGKTDILVGGTRDFKGPGLVFLPGRGDGTFGAPVPSATTGSYTSIAAGDFNKDGKLDVAATTISTSGVTILLGNGDGTFRTSFTYATGQGADTVIAADFNGDGKLDLATANEQDNTVSVLLGNGDGKFQRAVNYPAGSAPWSLVTADFNGDGKPDLAVLNLGTHSVSVLLNKGDGTFGSAITSQCTNDALWDNMVAGDFNDDGKTDLAGITDSGVLLLPGNGDGSFGTPVTEASFRYGSFIAAGDLRGDGRQDIVAEAINSAIVLLNNGPGKPMTQASYVIDNPGSPPSSQSVAVADFNGDGKPEIVSADEGTGDVTVLTNRGDGTFTAATLMPVIGQSAGEVGDGAFTTGDFNGDGRPDLVLSIDASIWVLPGRGDGTFSAPIITPLSPGILPHAIATADFDRDGHLDLLLDIGGQALTILFGNGDGTFSTSLQLTVPENENVQAMAVGDFNGDGKPDIAAVGKDVLIYLNQGDGTFAAPLVIPNIGSSDFDLPAGIAAADFNGDKKLDLVVTTLGGTDVLLGNGDGTFQPPVHYDGGGTFVTVADFNGDGKPDFATVHRIASDSINVYLNKGDGTFEPAITSFAGQQADDFVAGDFDGNGTTDLVVPTSFGYAFLEGQGDGTFQAPVYLAASSFMQPVVGDFNGDGHPDLITEVPRWDIAALFNSGVAAPASLTLNPIADQSVKEGSTLTLTAAATDSVPGRTLSYSLAPGAPAGASIDPKTGALSWTPPAGPATATIMVFVKDSASTPLSSWESFHVSVADVPPQVTIGPTSVSSPGFHLTGTGSFTDPGAETWTATVDYGDGSGVQPLILQPDKTCLLDHIYPGPGHFTGTVVVTDSGGASGNVLFPVAIDPNASLSLAPIADQSVKEGSTLTLTASATDSAPDAALTYSLAPGAPAGASIDPKTGVFRWTPAAGPATKSITVRVADNRSTPLSATQAFHVSVADVPPRPAIDPTSVSIQGSRLTGAGSFTDPGAETWTGTIDYDDGSGVRPLTLGAGKTFTLDHVYPGPGLYTVTVDITDSGGQSGEVQLPVEIDAGASLVIAPIPDQTVNAGSTLTLTVLATDTGPRRTLTYSLDPGAPAGAVIDPKTGVFTWTPAVGPATATIIVRVTDNGSPPLSPTRSFQVNVVAVPPQVTIDPATITIQNAQLTGAGSFADPGAKTWTATVDYGDGSGVQPLPLGADRTFTLDHVYPGPGSYTATVVVTDSGGQSAVVRVPVLVSSSNTPNAPGPNVEPPVIIAIQPVATRKMQSLVITFSQAMDPQRIFDAKAYLLGIPKHGKKGKPKTVRLAVSSYDAAKDSVTLLLQQRVKPGQKLQGTIFGSGPDGLIGASGTPLDGSKDGQPGGNDSFVVVFPRAKAKKT